MSVFIAVSPRLFQRASRVLVVSSLAALAALATGMPAAFAQAYPNKPIQLIVPFAPGGPADIVGRIVGEQLQQDLGQPVIIINRDGGGTSIGANAVAKSAPDGYTLLMGNDAASINAASGRKLPYDLNKDLVPVILVYSGPQILLANKNSPHRGLKDLVAYTKSKPPGTVKYGSGGIASSTHLASASFTDATDIKPIHAPYRGIAPAVNDLLGGHIDFLVAGTAAALPLIRSGSARGLAILSKTRISLLPDLPTAIEQGINVESAGWYGVFAPAGTPPDILNRLNTLINAAMRTPSFRERLQALAGEPQGGTQEQFAAFVRSEVLKFTKLMKDNDIKLD